MESKNITKEFDKLRHLKISLVLHIPEWAYIKTRLKNIVRFLFTLSCFSFFANDYPFSSKVQVKYQAKTKKNLLLRKNSIFMKKYATEIWPVLLYQNLCLFSKMDLKIIFDISLMVKTCKIETPCLSFSKNHENLRFTIAAYGAKNTRLKPNNHSFSEKRFLVSEFQLTQELSTTIYHILYFMHQH